MRFRLILLSSLAGALIGIALEIAIVVAALGSWTRSYDPVYNRHEWVMWTIPLLIGLLAGVFVYRHTARRRKLQSVLTGILVLVLYAAGLILLFLSHLKF